MHEIRWFAIDEDKVEDAVNAARAAAHALAENIGWDHPYLEALDHLVDRMAEASGVEVDLKSD